VSAVSVKLTRIVPPMIVILLLIANLVDRRRANDSAIFPTPWQVVTGAWELAQDGTFGSTSDRRCPLGIGFGLAF